ncbi:toxin 3FTx-Dis4-like [Erythrolamprus reginae]|uniref:toxin 3FTx-Dis4-like n=1 Tax=Erythrolamprus reginae TaxID=121349 RepID=UPI00396C6BAA
MKTLLLSLVLVAFVYLDSGDAITCNFCDTPLPLLFCNTFEVCPDSSACYRKETGLHWKKVDRGCATNCTLPAADEKITYCRTNYCN